MSKDTRVWAGLPAKLSLVVAVSMLSPALVQANTEEDKQSSESSWEQQESSQSSQGGSEALNQLAEQEGDLSEFVKAIEKSGMGEALTGSTKYTIFAPTNDAIENDANLQELLESGNQEELVKVLRAHIVADDVDPEMARTIGKAQTVGGGTVELTTEGDTLKIGDNQVVNADIQQDNLRVYTIDGVLEPSAEASMASSGSSESSGQSDAMAGADFDELDQNGDGYLDEEELQAQQDVAAEQSELDSNQDGRVSRTEFAAFEQGSSMPSSSDPRSSSDQSGSDIPPHNEGESDWQSDEQ